MSRHFYSDMVTFFFFFFIPVCGRHISYSRNWSTNLRLRGQGTRPAGHTGMCTPCSCTHENKYAIIRPTARLFLTWPMIWVTKRDENSSEPQERDHDESMSKLECNIGDVN